MHIEEHLWLNEATGRRHRTGCLPAKHAGKLRSVRDAQPQMPVLSRDEIVARLQSLGGSFCLPFQGPCYKQGGYNWCWDFSTCQMVKACCGILFNDWSDIDPSMGAGLCDNFANTGDSIDAVLTEVLQPVGICKAKFIGSDPYGPAIVQPQSAWPAGWQAEAAKRKAVESVTAPDFLTLASGILDGHPGELGVNWQGGGHAIGCLEIGLTPSGGLYMATPGTWGDDFTSGWGAYGPAKPGWYKLSEDQCAAAWEGRSPFGAYLLVGMTDQEAGLPAG